MPKPALVLVPGLMCNEDVWEPLLGELARTHHCTVVDHGQADSLSAMARNVLRHAPSTFSLAGHSMGGRVALEVLRQAPARVERVALMNTGYLARDSAQAGQREMQVRYELLKLAMDEGVETMARQWVAGMVAPSHLQDLDLIERIVDMFKTKSVDIFKHQIAALLNRPDATQVLKNLKHPTLILCTEHDHWSPVSQHQAMADLMPQKPAFVQIMGSGHMCTLEAPIEVTKALRDWL